MHYTPFCTPAGFDLVPGPDNENIDRSLVASVSVLCRSSRPHLDISRVFKLYSVQPDQVEFGCTMHK